MNASNSHPPLPPIPRRNPPRTSRSTNPGHPLHRASDDDEDDDTPLALMKPPKKRANPFSQTSSVSRSDDPHPRPNFSFADDRLPTSSRVRAPSPPAPLRVRSEVNEPLNCHYTTCREVSDSRDALYRHLVEGHPEHRVIATVLGNLPAIKHQYGGMYTCPVKDKVGMSVCRGRDLRIDQLESHVLQCAEDTMDLLAAGSSRRDSRSIGRNTGNDHRRIGSGSRSSQHHRDPYERGPPRSQYASRPSPPPSPAARPILPSPVLARWMTPTVDGPSPHRRDSRDDRLERQRAVVQEQNAKINHMVDEASANSAEIERLKHQLEIDNAKWAAISKSKRLIDAGPSVPVERPPKRPLPFDPADPSASSSGRPAKKPAPALGLAERFSDVKPKWKDGVPVSANERQQRAFDRHWIEQLIPPVAKGEQRVCSLCNREVYLGPKDLEAAESVFSECEIHLSGQHTDEWDSILDGSAFKVASPPSA